ncbi:MAG: hypothetical protein A2161_02110 [Candidatus Schekmanbacteria bacterium RBG_13_48_7]|uniref:Ribosomal protein L11 methyltransferase n=1 Tax=Candidatus Schekmanbacteria bacterium RBG_13_48_7 TaxID=1817878 RepID=A0A1F7RX92_9BACT|nr:MAG: hypothetical protein A2161_02110 [Candidatus Schekmanbacteria bacterium RBG_13_48_7]
MKHKHCEMHFIKIIWELDAEVEDIVVELLLESGAIGFETKPGSHRELELNAYFQNNQIHQLKDSLTGLQDRLNIYFPDSYSKPEIVHVQSRNWLDEWKQYFRPFHVSRRIVICPSWISYTPVHGENIISIDPGQAFGTGLHESTGICIKEMENFVKQDMHILDIGSGSGILSIAGINLGASSCISLEIDFDCCIATRKNAELNKFNLKITPICVDALKWLPNLRFDLILANILPDVLLKLVPALLYYKGSNSTVFLSGIPLGEESDLVFCIEKMGFRNIQTRNLNDWLLLRFNI